jgi:acyl carrier protein phosphodiesterase
MNHLAHIVLAGPDEGLRLGAFLGDHVRGRQALATLPPAWADGVMLHRRIDTLSDAHPAVRGLLQRLQSPWRRYGGVIFDILFDHMLTRHWDRFGQMPLARLAGEVDELLARHTARLPDRLVLFSRWARERGLWMRYGDPGMIDEIFRRLARRHGRPGPLADGIELLDAMEHDIEQAFLEMFPDLVEQAAEERRRLYSRRSSM